MRVESRVSSSRRYGGDTDGGGEFGHAEKIDLPGGQILHDQIIVFLRSERKILVYVISRCDSVKWSSLERDLGICI